MFNWLISMTWAHLHGLLLKETETVLFQPFPQKSSLQDIRDAEDIEDSLVGAAVALLSALDTPIHCV